MTLQLLMFTSCFSDLELKPVGTLDVKLVQGKDLTNKDIVGKSDPFAVLFIRPLRSRMKTSKTIVRQLPIFHYLGFLCLDQP
jgi:Ca2+-dependent lipid-binding protein